MRVSNYPNPFNPTTTLSFEIQKPASVSLRILDVCGRQVQALRNNTPYATGRHKVHWDGRTDADQVLPSGVYLCRLEIHARSVTRKITLLR